MSLSSRHGVCDLCMNECGLVGKLKSKAVTSGTLVTECGQAAAEAGHGTDACRQRAQQEHCHENEASTFPGVCQGEGLWAPRQVTYVRIFTNVLGIFGTTHRPSIRDLEVADWSNIEDLAWCSIWQNLLGVLCCWHVSPP